MTAVRILLPSGLQALASINAEVTVTVSMPVTTRAALQALEERYPALSGAVIDPSTGQRRPLIRFFACREDISHESLDAPLPDAVARGEEPLLIVGAIAGG